MKKEAVSGFMIALIVVSMLTLAFNIQSVKAEPTTWTVDDDGPADFSSIQEAINSPLVATGDTILVRAGTYYENVVVNKQLNIIGAGAEVTTVEASNPNDDVFYVTANNVTISGFTVKDATDWTAGVCLNYSDYSRIENINVLNNGVGVFLSSSSYNTVSGNTITNTVRGVYLYPSSNNNTVSGNTVTNNYYGVFFVHSSNNTVSGNNITNNTSYGVYLSSSSNNTFSGNTITNSSYGVGLTSSSSNTFYHNNFVDNTQHVYFATPGDANHWNSSYPTGGNYWSNYTGVDEKSGPNQDEAGSDGIGDTPHVLDDWKQDNYPYMNLWGPVHNINTTLNYWTIQEAIDAFETLDGHTIQVDAGTYVENVDVDKQLSIIGAGAEVTTVEASNPKDHVFYVTANNVTISGFTVKDAIVLKAGIYLNYSNYSRIENINVLNNYVGVWLNSSSYNTVSGNTITNNGHGIHLSSSSNNTISENTIMNNHMSVQISQSSHNIVSENNIESNGGGVGLILSSNNTFSSNNITDNDMGVHLLSSSNNTVSSNNITNNKALGVHLISSSNNTISGNTITNNNRWGVFPSSSSYNTVSGNTITNTRHGVYLYSSSNNTFSSNNITDNDMGVRLISSSYNTVSSNNITDNDMGVRLYNSSDNTFYHNNFIDNTQHVYIDTPGYANHWNSSYPTGGNYWSNYAGADEHSGLAPQDGIGSDGIGDDPYVIDGDNQDNYPFMGQNGWENHPFTIESNVTITSRRLTTSTLNFNVSGSTGLLGYINITMPMGLNTTNIIVLVDGTELPPPFPIITNNSTHYFIYFEFPLSTHAVVIQFACIVPSPSKLVEKLIETIETWNLPKGIENSLTSKLDGVIHLLNKGNENGPVHILGAFVNHVEAMCNKKLTYERTDFLIAEAQRIIDLIEG